MTSKKAVKQMMAVGIPRDTARLRSEIGKDVLLAAFPNAHMDDNGIPDICPRALDKNYNNCSDFADCSVCKCAYWLAEIEEK